MFKKVKDQKGIKLQQRKASLLVQVEKTLSPKRYKLSLVSNEHVTKSSMEHSLYSHARSRHITGAISFQQTC